MKELIGLLLAVLFIFGGLTFMGINPLDVLNGFAGFLEMTAHLAGI